ncbi:hypothetical protein N9O56_00290 [Rickettsiales bacterium]|nr:hypothetical protein [Rickettsiales bacterium]
MPIVHPDTRHRKAITAWPAPSKTTNANKEQARAPGAKTSQVTTEDKKQELTTIQQQEQKNLKKFKKLAFQKGFFSATTNPKLKELYDTIITDENNKPSFKNSSELDDQTKKQVRTLLTNNKTLSQNKELFTFLEGKLNEYKLMPPPSLNASDSDANDSEEDSVSVILEDSQSATETKQQTPNQEQTILQELQKVQKSGNKANIIYKIFVVEGSLVLRNAEEAQAKFNQLTKTEKNKVKDPNSLKELINKSFREKISLSPQANKLYRITGLQKLLEENFLTQANSQVSNRSQPPSLDQSSSSEEEISVSASNDCSQKSVTIDVASATSEISEQKKPKPPTMQYTSSRSRRDIRSKQKKTAQVIRVKSEIPQISQNDEMAQLRAQLAAAKKRAANAEHAQKAAEARAAAADDAQKAAEARATAADDAQKAAEARAANTNQQNRRLRNENKRLKSHNEELEEKVAALDKANKNLQFILHKTRQSPEIDQKEEALYTQITQELEHFTVLLAEFTKVTREGEGEAAYQGVQEKINQKIADLKSQQTITQGQEIRQDAQNPNKKLNRILIDIYTNFQKAAKENQELLNCNTHNVKDGTRLVKKVNDLIHISEDLRAELGNSITSATQSKIDRYISEYQDQAPSPITQPEEEISLLPNQTNKTRR